MLVLIFAVAAAMMVATGLAMTDSHAKMQGDLERHQNLQAVLKAGIAAALNEINRDEYDGISGNYDPGRDGVGAITGWDGTTDPTVAAPPGVPWTVVVDGAPRTLGYYRTTVDKTRSPGKALLTVVAAWPSFDAPPDRVLLAAAEMEIKTTIETITVRSGAAPVNPINIAGVVGGGFSVQVDGSSSVQVSGIDLAGASNVPAANVEDGGLLAQFAAAFATPAEPFVGADIDDPESTTTDVNQTITNAEPQALSVENLQSLYARYTTEVLASIPGATKITAKVSDGTTLTLNYGPDQVYYADSLLVDKTGVIEGEGTLIVSRLFHLKGELHWNGDVIVAGYEASTGAVTTRAQVHLNDSSSPAVLDVTGNVIMLSETMNQFHLNNDSQATIDGALLLLSDKDASQAQFHLNNGTGLTVTGVTAVMADVAHYHQNNNTSMTTNSLNFALRNSDPALNKLDVKLNANNALILNHHSVETAEALEALGVDGYGAGGDPKTISIKTVATKTYWERGVLAVRSAQQAQFAAAPDGAWGY